jgi:hypothetical protein
MCIAINGFVIGARADKGSNYAEEKCEKVRELLEIKSVGTVYGYECVLARIGYKKSSQHLTNTNNAF